ncbi:MAG: hypothetical protein ACLFUS_01885 [Candidatus Sumerlaeia bacterium]
MNIGAIIGLIIGVLAVLLGNIYFGGQTGCLCQFGVEIILCGGVLGALLIQFQWKDIVRALVALKDVFWLNRGENQQLHILTDLVGDVREKGLKAIEERLAQIKDPYLVGALANMMDIQDEDQFEQSLWNEMERRERELQQSVSFWQAAGRYSILFSIAGVFLVALADISKQLEQLPISLGALEFPHISAMVFMIVYGFGSAALICFPISGRIRAELEKQRHWMGLVNNDVMTMRDSLLVQGDLDKSEGDAGDHEHHHHHPQEAVPIMADVTAAIESLQAAIEMQLSQVVEKISDNHDQLEKMTNKLDKVGKSSSKKSTKRKSTSKKSKSSKKSSAKKSEDHKEDNS